MHSVDGEKSKRNRIHTLKLTILNIYKQEMLYILDKPNVFPSSVLG